MKSLPETQPKQTAIAASSKRPELLPATIARLNALVSQYPSLQRLAEVYHPSQASRYSRYPERCICGNAPTLVDLNNAYGENSAVKWLIAQLVSYQEGINTPNKMQPLQYTSLAERIVQEFYYLKCTDIHLFLAHLAAGTYNIDYHGYVSPDIILDTLRNRYIPYRDEVARREEEKRQKQLEQQESKRGITWEEFCRLENREITASPFDRGSENLEQKPEEE